ncbi:MAG: 2-nitropropane dioxygenase [Spirochaetaceae bacterium 4572_59]|nr:MAG: 2-nitropropane dioxygenase [Spirochaetaceae bacterium 4572_59]
MTNPIIIQGGMGIAVSNWRLARAVSKIGQLGVISGTSLDGVLARRLQDGDPGGHMRRALDAFPFKDSAKRIIDKYFVTGGIKKEHNYTQVPMFKVENNDDLNELTVAANFTETYLAKEGHNGLVGVNYLEKVQLPHLPSIYGALLAGIDYIIMGAGIPLEIPGILKTLADNCKATMKINVDNAAKEDNFFTQFDPAALFGKELPSLKMPRFLPIISSNFLATLMAKKASGPIDGFIIENFQAGGHNAPPRGKMNFDEWGEPIYGDRDMVDIEKIKELGLPFWLAGSYGGPDKLQAALATGAAGIQVGTAFALCEESAIVSDLKKQIIQKMSRDEEEISTDTKASPTGFPFKVIKLADTISESSVFQTRRKVCNLGYLRTLYKKDDGSVGYRCPAESKAVFEKKGGTSDELTAGKKCLCNALFATVGLPTGYKDGTIEKPLVTIGSNVESIKKLIKEKTEFSAEDVVDFILKPEKSIQ